MIKRGIFNAVDMTAANVLILNVLRRAKDMGLKTDELRSMDRLRMCVEALVVWDAIDLVFDSESSSLKDRMWHPHHLIEVEKHLVAKKRHVSLAFGLCASQWEDPMRQKVQNAIVQYVRKNTTKVVLNPSLANQGVVASWFSSVEGGQAARVEHTDVHTPVVSNYVSCPHGLGKNNKAKTRPHNRNNNNNNDDDGDDQQQQGSEDYVMPTGVHELMRSFAFKIFESMPAKPTAPVAWILEEAAS